MEEKLRQLQQEIDDLKKLVYRNNFSTNQIFDKKIIANYGIGQRNLSATPTSANVGDLVCVGAKLYICTVASISSPTWVVVGTQT